MRKMLTIIAGCGLALGAAACGKHDDGNSGANLSASDNMLVPSDENAGDAAMANDAGNAVVADNAMGGGTANAGNAAQ